MRSIGGAVARARVGILTIAATYVLAVILGAVMVHSGSRFALDYADGLVASAQATDPAARALQQDSRLQAALLDFSRNLLLGAIPSTLGGVAIVVVYPVAAFRGWVGGIVSVQAGTAHASRLADPAEAFYYLVTLILQLIPYALAGGAGVNVGLAVVRPRACYPGDGPLGFSREALRDVVRIYVLVVPLFLVASLWEFLAR